MPFTFPSSPTVGQQSTQNGRVYAWSGSAWELVSVPAALSSTNISDSTVAGRALLTGADATAQRTSLGLGTMAQATAANYLERAGGTMTGVVQVTAGTAAAPGVAISGDTDTGIVQAGGANTLGVATNGVERWRVGADGSAQSVIPGGTTLMPQFQCRAWVNFNGMRDTNDAASSANTNRLIRGSGNVASVQRIGVGGYLVTFSTAMPDTNYAFFFGVRADNDTTTNSTRIAYAMLTSTKTTTQMHFVTSFAGGLVDYPEINVCVFR